MAAAYGVDTKLCEAIKLETENIKAVWGTTYSSNHEAYAVLMEEVEEAETDMNVINSNLHSLWEKVKSNFESVDRIDTTTELISMQINAKEMAKECVQIAAVCEKFMNTLMEKGVEN